MKEFSIVIPIFNEEKNIKQLVKEIYDQDGIKNKLLNEDSIFESIIAFKRAGAGAIISYFAIDIAKKLIR